MSQIIAKDNFIEAKYDAFKKCHQQLAVIIWGAIEDFRSMTIGWELWEMYGDILAPQLPCM